MYVRTKSILESIEKLPPIKEINIEELQDSDAIKIIKLIYQFQNILENVISKNEPSILSRYLINIAQAYSSYYNSNKILVEEKERKMQEYI